MKPDEPHVSPQPFSRSREYCRKHYTLPQSQQNPNGTTQRKWWKCPIYGHSAIVTGMKEGNKDFNVSTMWYNIGTKKVRVVLPYVSHGTMIWVNDEGKRGKDSDYDSDYNNRK